MSAFIRSSPFKIELLPRSNSFELELMTIEFPDSALKETPQYATPEAIKTDFAAWLYEREILTLA